MSCSEVRQYVQRRRPRKGKMVPHNPRLHRRAGAAGEAKDRWAALPVRMTITRINRPSRSTRLRHIIGLHRRLLAA